MSPRTYQLGRRQAAVDATRQKVLDAARELLADPDGQPGCNLDAVAKRADVARATVYYRFGTKSGLLEALFDALAERELAPGLAAAFTTPDPQEALRLFVACFGRFWASDRLVLRRVRAIAALDSEVGPVIRARDERRRTGLQLLAGRLDAARGTGGDRAQAATAGDDRIGLAHTLTSFETFDALAGPDREPGEVIPAVTDLVLHVMATR
jgi:AcrR family transcriptional regulator